MSSFFTTYLTVWATLCGLAIILAIRLGRQLEITHPVYWRALLVPWKLITFLVAAAGMMIIAPWTGDPTWDWFDAGFMAVFAYAGAPWAVGVLYQGLRGWQPVTKIYVALCLWMFSASWSYDLYILLRDGEYPGTWAANIAASSILYACAGMMWSLEWREGRGVIFSFMERDWPLPPDPRSLSRIIWFALPFMVLVGVMILAFLVDYLGLLR
jgi:hypothetical protein